MTEEDVLAFARPSYFDDLYVIQGAIAAVVNLYALSVTMRVKVATTGYRRILIALQVETKNVAAYSDFSPQLLWATL